MELEYFFIVPQTWIDASGNVGIQGFVFKEESGQPPAVNRALSTFHNIMSLGAVSTDQYVASQVIRSDGATIKPFEYFDRRPVPQEATPATPATPSEPEPEPDAGIPAEEAEEP